MVANQVKLLNYSLSEKIYEGSNTIVYRGICDLDQQPVILKILRHDYPRLNELVQFRNQYAIAQKLTLPGVVKPYSLENYRNGYVLAMEDFGGISLKAYMNNLAIGNQEDRTQNTEYRIQAPGDSQSKIPSGAERSLSEALPDKAIAPRTINPKSKIPNPPPPSPLPLDEFFPIAIQIADSLNGLYRHRVIHKDLKPDNILINPETKQVKLIDFSIASLLPRETQEIQNPNGLEGTLAYMSPEQTGRMNRGIDYRTDFYSLGATFYELLTGQIPFITNDPMELVHSHIAKQPVPIHRLNPNLPTILSDIVEKLMAKNAEDRYQSALGLKYDLDTCCSQWGTRQAIAPFELGQRDISDYFVIPEKLYGREKEVQTLLDAFERVSGQPADQPQSIDGRSEAARSANQNPKSEMMLVAGLSGIGKTAVVNEIHKPIVRQRGYFIKGKFDQFRRDIPFLAIVQAFRDFMGQLLTESKAQVDQWRRKILDAVGENGQVIIDVIPEVELLIGKQPTVAELEPSASQNRFYLLFQKFIRVFPSVGHPLVMFLDDLQWADSASLQVIQALMAETDTHHLLLIGAYRDNEVSPVHPLMLTLDSIKNKRVGVNTITLEPLSQNHLNRLISETLNCSEEVANSLTQLVIAKTKGNPFFSNQFLKSLHADGHISFNFDLGRWQWDVRQIRTLALTDDVVEFVANQLKKLPDETQKVLTLAACIGNPFELRTLALVNGKTKAETAADLWQALQAEVILLGNEAYRINQGENLELRISDPEEIASNAKDWLLTADSLRYRFLHDRVQQAAYSLIPEDQKPSTHLRIGQLLLHCTPPEEREEKIFELVNQLNHGVDLITYRKERKELAQLNLVAGRQAKNSTAYVAAVKYLTTGIGLLETDSWETNYALTIALHNEAAEAAYLETNFEKMAAIVQLVLAQAKTLLDRMDAYQVRMEAYKAQNQGAKAIETGIQVLKLFDIELPQQPSPEDVQLGLKKTLSTLEGQRIEELVDLPTMTDPAKLAVMNFLGRLLPIAYTTNPLLFTLIALKQVDLSLRYGNCAASATSYLAYGITLWIVFDDIDSNYRLGQLALELLERFDAQHIKSFVIYVVNTLSRLWKRHIRETLSPLQKAYAVGLETGDLEHATYSIYIYLKHSFWLGKELTTLEQEMVNYHQEIGRLKQAVPLQLLTMDWQTVLNLLGSSDNPCSLSGKAYEEQSMLPLHLQANNRQAICLLYIQKLFLCYLFQDYPQALNHAELAKEYLDAAAAQLAIVIFYFYHSLAMLATYFEVSQPEQRQILQQVSEHQTKLKDWAEQAPENFLHKHCLIEAERLRVLGDHLKAMELYDRAINLARENGYINEEALSSELAAKFYLAWDKEFIAQSYMTHAYYGYARWGAKAKLDVLEKSHPELLTSILRQERTSLDYGHKTSSNSIISLSQTKGHTGSIFRTGRVSDVLDLTTVIKASQALSGEIQLQKLLSILMRVVLENAGAEAGALILHQNGSLVIQAQASFDKYDSETLKIISLQSVPIETSQEIPVTLINYVSRTSETLVIEDATIATTFAADSYIIERQPKSVLCTPICNQGKLIGILYLENNLTTGAFTQDRLEILKLLTSQAAISLENALLYDNLAVANKRLEEYSHTLEQKVAERTQELKEKNQHLEHTLQELKRTQAQLIQTEKMSGLGQMVAGIAHEINNPINFIYGNIEHAHKYVQDLLDLISIYQQEYSPSNKTIEEKARKIELDFLTQDLPKILDSMQVGSDRIRTIVLGLRNFSRLDEAEMKPVDIRAGIDSTLMILQHRFKANANHPAIEVIKEYGRLPQVPCYASQLNQVFMNILSNAIDALESFEGWQVRSLAGTDQLTQSPVSQFVTPPTPTIRICTELVDTHTARIRIADNGPGMIEEIKQKIFDPFFTTKPVGDGTGLGLSISYQIVVNKHKGQLICNSTPEQGAEFRIEIPIQQV